jgi:electron transfer flavoprotein alpha subunit
MSKILIVAEHDGTALNQSTARCVACARRIPGASISIGVFGADPREAAHAAAKLQGVAEVVTVSNSRSSPPLAAVLAPQIAALACEYTHIFGPSSTFGKDLMAHVAGLLGVGQISDVMDVENGLRFKRPIYAGNAIAVVECDPSKRIVATVRLASFEPVGAQPGAPIRAAVIDVPLPSHTRFVATKSGNSDRPDLQTASKVVSAGRAIGSAENFKLVYSVAQRLGAAVGASRAAVDAGFAPNELQVGQTGKIIAPELYVAIGISGAIQHLTGIKDARTIVAINKDPAAPIFEVADFGLVGDLFQIIPEIEQLLSK